MPSKDGWTHDRDHDKVQLGKKQYRNMEEWSRPCAVCGEKFSIYVRGNAPGGLVNSSFGLRTCRTHRGEKPGTAGMPAPGEVDTLRTANATMSEELTGLYARLREQGDTIDMLQDMLSRYELGPAMAAAAAAYVKPVQLKMPWEA